jgi:hypothetical protein
LSAKNYKKFWQPKTMAFAGNVALATTAAWLGMMQGIAPNHARPVVELSCPKDIRFSDVQSLLLHLIKPPIPLIC